MSTLIVIRIVPQSPVKASDFTNYLTALGGLQISAFDLSFDKPTDGVSVGDTAKYIAPKAGTPSPTNPLPILPPPPPIVFPQYPFTAGTTKSGIIQQWDLQPPSGLESAYFQLESVATAVIEVDSPATIENLRLVVQWGSGAGSQPVPVTLDYYNVAMQPGPLPDPNATNWATLPPSLYLQLPAPPTNASGTSFSLPTDGSIPSFDALLKAVQTVLKADPGGAMPDLATLTLAQCRNLAYEIVWSQRPPVPVVPDPADRPLETLYTNPPNNGTFLSGTTPNQNEGDRRQFEAQLQSYYALPDANADRLTNYVYSLCAAVACEELSLAATQTLLEFPVNPGQPSNAPINETEVILTAIGNANSPGNFGVPAAYFYALGASMPPQINAAQRYQLATSDHLQHVLTNLTSVVTAGIISDAEGFISPTAPPPAINTAQAARRMVALQIPTGSSTPLAPLDTVALLTSADTASGKTLPFSSTSAVKVGMTVTGAKIPAGTTVSTLAATSLTFNNAIAGAVPGGSSITFTPAYSSDLQQLVQAWLAYPQTVGGQQPTSAVYQPSDDAAKFWPSAANGHASAFLNLILCALTDGYIIPAPFNVSLGDQIITFLAKLSNPNPPTVATLASVTVKQWQAFFQQNPTWLPTFTQPEIPMRAWGPGYASFRNSSRSLPAAPPAPSYWLRLPTLPWGPRTYNLSQLAELRLECLSAIPTVPLPSPVALASSKF